MPIKLGGKGEKNTTECATSTEQKGLHYEKGRINVESISQKNLRAKKAMARELLAMGLSEETANRVLHLNGKPEEELVLNQSEAALTKKR